MSAWLCTDLHISVIARETCPFAVALQEWANYLKRINIESVNYRYKENSRKTKCQLIETDVTYSPDDIGSLIRCYLYQACEKPSIEFATLDVYMNSHIKGDPNKSQLWGI